MNITKLKQGALNGLRRQTNECLESAYNKGYEDGAKNQDEVQYQNGYNKGYEDGKKCISERISENKLNEAKADGYNNGYNNGYNTAINDYNMMIQWLHDCTDDFKEFMNKKYGYDIMYLTNPKVDEGVMLYDLICDHDIAEVISEFQKWQKEKKKAEEEFRVGDILYSEMTDSKAIIISFDAWDNWNCIDTCGTGFAINESKREFWKKIGHFDGISQLLDKLRGEQNDR